MIIFDLDDTLRCTKGSEVHYPEDCTRTENWLAWQDYVNGHGAPIQHIVDLYHTVYDCDLIVILTSSQYGTLQWLDKHSINVPDVIEERAADDHRTTLEMKKDHVKKWKGELKLWVDDHIEMCDYVESLGIPVVRVVR